MPDSVSVDQEFYQYSTSVLAYLCSMNFIEDISEYEMVSCKDLVEADGTLSPRLLPGFRTYRRYRIIDVLLPWMESSVLKSDVMGE